MTALNYGPPGHVNFLQIADECRVIRTSPAWTEVARTLEWIDQTERAGEAVDVTDERLGQLKQFADLIEESSATIAHAMFCGTAIGVCIEKGPLGEKTHRGLRAISNAYHFDQVGDEGVVAALQKVMSLLSPKLPLLSHWTPTQLGNRDVIDDWQRQLNEDLTSLAEELEKQRYDMPALQQDAWKRWSEHLKQPDFTSNAANEPSLAELCCAAADVAPTSIIGFDTSKVSLAGWGTLVRHVIANPSYAPNQGPLDQSTGRIMSVPSRLEWVIPVALHAVGFRMSEGNFVERLSQAKEPTELAELSIERFPWLFKGKTPLASVLLLSLAVDSVAKNWLPQDNIAILVLPQANNVEIGEVLSQDSDRLLWVGGAEQKGARVPLLLTHVVVEMPNTSGASTQSSEDAFNAVREYFGVQAVRLYSERPKDTIAHEGAIIAKDVADFTTQLLRIQQA